MLAIIALILTWLGAWFAWDRYQRNAPRREALAVLVEMERLLATADAAKVVEQVVMPTSAPVRTPVEQAQWLKDILRDELSPAGIAKLRRSGSFGPLAEIFPDEALRWADAAKVRVGDCVAFRIERNGVRAEVVLLQTASGFRVVRCNNVKQMAPPILTKS